jgi:hypothetical protein
MKLVTEAGICQTCPLMSPWSLLEVMPAKPLHHVTEEVEPASE